MKLESHWDTTEEDLLGWSGSFREVLARFRGHVSPLLVGEREWDRLLERAAALPATLGAFPFGFELPLHEACPRADLGISLHGESRSAAFFAEGRRAERTDPSLARIVRLLEQMRPEGSHLRRVVGTKMLLEYDIPRAPQRPFPEPGVFLYPVEGTLAADVADRRLQDLGLMVDAVVSAAGWDFDPVERQRVEHIYRAMQPGTGVRAVGAFPSRRRAIRVAVTGLRKASEVMAFLERAEWSGRPAKVASLVSRLEKDRAFRELGVHFDLRTDGPAPTLGLSCFVGESEWLKDFRFWTALMDSIREAGYAVPEKLSALASSSCGAETLFSRSGLVVLLRGIHHIKFVVAGDRIEQVKAYTFFWMRRMRL